MNEEKGGYMIPLAIVAAGALIGAGIYFSGGRPQTSASNELKTAPIESKTPTNADLIKGSMTLGDPNAPVVMVEYGDYQCPFCGKFFTETRQTIIDTYVKSGKVLFAYKDFAFLGSESKSAAEAAHCANDQGKFWQYHDALYGYLWSEYYSQNKNGENVGAYSPERLKTIAKNIGLDVSAFSSCLENGTHTQTVLDQTEEGRAFGVSGTPAFFINGKLITGALPFSQFQKVIEEAIKNSK